MRAAHRLLARGTAAALALALAGAAPAAPGAAPLLAAPAAEILGAVRAPGARAVLVNVWATWCVPCREEFPALLRLRRAYAARGLRVLFVSGDFAADRAQAEAFLREQGVDFATYLKTGDDGEFIDAFDPAWTGALPATFIYDAAGRRRASLFGAASYETFEARIRPLIGSE